VAQGELLGGYQGNRHGCTNTQTEHHSSNDPGFKQRPSQCQMFITIEFRNQMWANL
jgi:hypothetical protein